MKDIPEITIHNPIIPFNIKTANRLFNAKKAQRIIKQHPAINVQYQLENLSFLRLKLSITRRIHLIIKHIHIRTMKILIIVSPNWGKKANKTHRRIWNIDRPAKIHLSSKFLSWIANTT